MYRLKKPLCSRKGMTLVELITASVIIALAALMLVSAYGLAFRLMVRGKDHETALDQAYRIVDTSESGVSATMTFSVRSIAGNDDVLIRGSLVRQDVTQGSSKVQLSIFRADPNQPGRPSP